MHNDDQIEKILNEMISNAGEKNMEWAYERLENLERRKKRNLESLHGKKRCFGYWRLKKVLKMFGIKYILFMTLIKDIFAYL